MLQNYLLIALRNLRKHPGYALINVVGLAVGVACCLLMMLFVRHELSFDRFHAKADRIVRVAVQQEGGATVNTPAPLAPTLESEFPEIEEAVRLGRAWTGVMQHGEAQFHETELFFTDPGFFDVFSIELTAGDPSTALDAPDGIVLTEGAARRYFGDTDPLGETLTFTFEGSQAFVVTGVMKPLPAASHFQFELLAPLASQPRFLEMIGENWTYNFRPTYLLLKDAQAAEALAQKLPAFVERHFPDEVQETTLALQPLTSIHLHSHLDGEHATNGRPATLYGFGAVALLILLIACVNFMNLATARSAGRAKEVGMRKVLGASRVNLIRQFLGEALLLSTLAVLLALVLAEAALPVFNDLTGLPLALFGAGGWLVLGGLVVLGLGVGVLAGSYPAFYLSAFRPAAVLKGKAAGSRGAASLRRTLVVVQFTVSIFFLIGIVVIQGQLDYLRERALGYEAEQLAYIRTPQRNAPMNFPLFQETLAQVPGVVGVAGASRVPGSGQPFNKLEVKGEGQGEEARLDAAFIVAHPDFPEAFGLSLSASDGLARTPSDSSVVFAVNAAAARAMGGGEALGRELAVFGPNEPEPFTRGRVVAVLEDFHFESLHHAVRPLIVSLTTDVFNWTFLAVRVRTDDLGSTLVGLETAWAGLAPEWPLDLAFLDDRVQALYAQEERLGRVLGYCTFLAVLIACLGLFGLAAFTAEQRTKEIGIRKVMGASVAGVVALLSKDFLRLVGVAFVVAVPLAYLAASRWLDAFAYRIDLSWPIFLIAGGAALGVAFLTVSYQAIKAALADPVKSLRYE